GQPGGRGDGPAQGYSGGRVPPPGLRPARAGRASGEARAAAGRAGRPAGEQPPGGLRGHQPPGGARAAGVIGLDCCYVVARSPDGATSADRRSPCFLETYGRGRGTVRRPCHNWQARLLSRKQQEKEGIMANTEQDLRLGILNTLLTTPHRKLDQIWPIHQEMAQKDPRFYVRLAAWYSDHGDVRDHKEMF